MKILIPVSSPTEDAKISEHFGRSPYFAIVEIENGNYNIKFIPNMREQGVRASEIVLREGVSLVVVTNIGMRALEMLKSAGVRVCKATKDSLREVINDVSKGIIQDFIEEGCSGKGHHGHSET
ncbi:MAG TPA: hypothetical protein ENI59_01300 [Euryarchaeota archaeon]|nr:hypothetical protein [Euryarchaeota archaeon]